MMNGQTTLASRGCADPVRGGGCCPGRAALMMEKGKSMTIPTNKEMEILNAADEIRFKLKWLAEHPGKTRRDWNRGMNDFDSEVWKWRRAKGRAANKAENAAWLRDHPGRPLPEHLCCGLTPAEVDEYEQWRKRRSA
jgi:hypothetical protein